MLKKSFISSVFRGKKLLLSALFVGLAAFSFASMNDDGGNKAKAVAPWRSNFEPVRITNSFTLKAGPNYHGSTIFNEEEHKPSYIQLNSLVTYQKGKVTYIIPYNNRVSV